MWNQILKFKMSLHSTVCLAGKLFLTPPVRTPCLYVGRMETAGYNLIETSLGREIRFEYVLQTSSPSQTQKIKSTINVLLVRDLS